MADAGIDVLMKVVGPNGPIAAESSARFTALAVNDPLASGFTPGQFCELKEFSFDAGVASLSKQNKREKEAKALEKRKQLDELDREEKLRLIQRAQDKRGEKRAKGDDIDMQPVEFTRILDCMSPQLLIALTQCDTLTSISVVKRKATGSANLGTCYLRLDFTGVLMTKLDWKDNEHVMMESGTFIYRKVTLRYRPQKADGSLGVAVQAEWEMRAAGAGT